MFQDLFGDGLELVLQGELGIIEVEETGLVFRPFIDPWVLAAAALLVVTLSILGYRRTTREVITVTAEASAAGRLVISAGSVTDLR